MTETEIAWLAGILEGEGSFIAGTQAKGYPSNKYRIQLQMCDKDIVDRVAALFGSSVIRYKPQKAGWQESFRTYLYGIRAAEVMLKILPYMGGRRRAKIEALLLGSNPSNEVA